MDTPQTTPPHPAPETPIAPIWQPLPIQARHALMWHGALVGLSLALLGRLVDSILRLPGHWIWMGSFAVAGAALGALWGVLRHRHTHWAMDCNAVSLRRGRLWQSEVRVPINRVQHLDLVRGPLDRHYGLASLVVHTAGSRSASVTLDGLALADAERLRDDLARQDTLDTPGSDAGSDAASDIPHDVARPAHDADASPR